MWQSIANIILRNRFIIIGILALMTTFFGYHAITGLELDNKYGILLPNNAEAKIDYEKFKEVFGEDGGSLVIAVETDSLYTEKNFLKWKELGDSILKMDGIKAVVSEATLFSIHNNREKEKFEAHRIFSDTEYKEKSIDSIKFEIRSNPLYRGLLYNEDETVSLMMVEVDESFITDQKKSNVVLDVEDLARSYSSYFGEPRFAGMPHLRVVIGKRVLKEMYIFIALLLLMTSLLMYFFFRSLRVVFICNLVVAIAVIWSMGTIGALNFNITIIMALIPPLMIVIGVPNCIFLLTKYHQEVKEHGNKAKALSRVIRKIGTATFLTNLTTSLGFLTFVSTNSTKLVQFGITASINIMMVFVLSITILPIIVSLSKTPKERHLKHLDRKLATGLLNTLVNITLNHRKWVYITTLAVVGMAIIGMTKIEATGNLSGDLPAGHPILEDMNFMQENFGGVIPFEILIDYKEDSRLNKSSTWLAVEELQSRITNDSLFSRSVSYIDALKAANMAFFDNDSSQYKLITQRRHLSQLKKYKDNSPLADAQGVGFSLNELIDTNEHILRVRCQMMDLGSYEVSDKADTLRLVFDSILNPNRANIEGFYKKFDKAGKGMYADSILMNNNRISNHLAEKYIKNEEDRRICDLDQDLFLQDKYNSENFKSNLRSSIDNEYFGITLTGTSIVASEGTKYMVINLFTSLLFAILAISILMSILFRSWKMVLVSLIPNLIPLVFTAGVMGWFGIPLKPSTLLVFSIAFGISVDDTIHYLAKYRQELKAHKWDLKQCAIMAIREAGLGMFYTSIILFCGFIMFAFSQFGGTKALGFLVSLTLLVAMITNLVLLPSLLLSLERRITTKSFEEPYFDAYAEESDIDWEHLDVEVDPELKAKTDPEEST
ncbi:MAG: putative RND superfamily exporter protein [Crocinitomicaceae bacterium]|jgi:predicted RND superfamily exporter protein